MELIKNTLHNYGVLGSELLKAAIQPLSATGKTVRSIGFSVSSGSDTDTLVIFGREFIATLETGRGPRKSGQKGDFEDNMIEYMQARGIGSDLSDKKRKQLARFLTWKINKEGDKTFKAGGRQVYSNDLDKFVDQLREALVMDFKLTFRNNLKDALRAVRT